jgi:2-hydroxychromene-2-carboxylate isomerase
LRGAIWLAQDERLDAYRKAAFRATWVDEIDVSNPEGAAQVAESVGIDKAAFVAGITEPNVKAILRENTERSIAAGGFGLPNFIVDGELYFGQDRLEQVKAACGL